MLPGCPYVKKKGKIEIPALANSSVVLEQHFATSAFVLLAEVLDYFVALRLFIYNVALLSYFTSRGF